MTLLSRADKRWGQSAGNRMKKSERDRGRHREVRERASAREGGQDAPAHIAPTHCCHISVFATMNHCMTYIWAPRLGENLTDIITWQFPPTCSKLQSCNSLVSGSLLPNWSGLSTWCDNIIHCEIQGCGKVRTPAVPEFQSIPRVAALFLLLWKTSVSWFTCKFKATVKEKKKMSLTCISRQRLRWTKGKWKQQKQIMYFLSIVCALTLRCFHLNSNLKSNCFIV